MGNNRKGTSDLIMEGLYNKRSGKILEGVASSVKSTLSSFFNDQKTPSQVKKRINNILNFIHLGTEEHNGIDFVGGENYRTEGSVRDNGTSIDVFPSVHEVFFYVDNVDDSWYTSLFKNLKKDMKSNFSGIDSDSYSINIGIDMGDSPYGYYIVIEHIPDNDSRYKVIVGNQVSPLNEAGPKSVSVVKYFKGSKPWDKYKFTFTRYTSPYGEVSIKVDCENEYWDSSDYAFIDLDDFSIRSYSSNAADYVKKALKVAGYSDRDYYKLFKPLHISESTLNETSLGTEIGLPIDKENCEGTDVSGVSTPSGTLNDGDSDDSNTKESLEPVKCPECGSINVNVVDGDIFHCSDCGFDWEDKNNDGEQENDEKALIDGMVDHSEDERPRKALNTGVTNSYVSDSRLNEGTDSTKGMVEDFKASVGYFGEIFYNGEEYFDIESELDLKSLLSKLVNSLKKSYKKVRLERDVIIINGDDEYHYLEAEVSKLRDESSESQNIYRVRYSCPM